MGQEQSNNHYLKNTWEYVDTFGRIEVYKNQKDQLTQKHNIRVNPKIELDAYMSIYEERYLPDKPIVSVYDAEVSEKNNDMCRQSSSVTVYTQYIPFRLPNISKLNHGQGLYVLSQSLAGFSQLYNRVGPFQINENLIGFNTEGQVKVWHNENFAQNSVDNDRVVLMSTKNPYDFDRKFSQSQQFNMVEDIFMAVSAHTNFNVEFLQQLQQYGSLKFNDSRKFVEYKISQKTSYIPGHLNLKNNSYILTKSGIKSKYKSQNSRVGKTEERQSYPFFLQKRNLENHQNVGLTEDYMVNEALARPYQSKIVYENVQSQVYPHHYGDKHLISGRQKSLYHQLPNVNQYSVYQPHIYFHPDREIHSPKTFHRHKIFQHSPEMIKGLQN